jgi:ribonuclease HI
MNLIIFTDGSCITRNNARYAGYGIVYPNGEFKNRSMHFAIEPITNQRAELYAIYRCLKEVVNSDKVFDKIIIHTDSMYSIKCLTEWIEKWIQNNWTGTNELEIKNQDIIKAIYKYMNMDKYKDRIEFKHVKAHTNNNDFYSIHNKEADKLATAGAALLYKAKNKS